MKIGLRSILLAALAWPLLASGPYSPPRIKLERDEKYEIGKALFTGDVKLGSGSSCGSCHVKTSAFNKKSLAAVRYNLQQRIETCVRTPDRVNGAIKSEQTEALVYYFAKRYGL